MKKEELVRKVLSAKKQYDKFARIYNELFDEIRKDVNLHDISYTDPATIGLRVPYTESLYQALDDYIRCGDGDIGDIQDIAGAVCEAIVNKSKATKAKTSGKNFR